MTEQKRTTACNTSVGADERQSLTNSKTIIPQESILDNPVREIFPEGAGLQSLASLPDEVRRSGRFCCWRYEDRDGKLTKVPYNPLTAERARSNDPSSFCSFEEAAAATEYDGLGIGIFNGICAIDLDNCIVDGEYTATAAEIIQTMHSYTEVSPSSKGVHILFEAPSFQYDTQRFYIMNRARGIEVYVAGATNKYVTVTGKRLNDYEFGNRAAELETILTRYMARNSVQPKSESYAVNAINAYRAAVEIIGGEQYILSAVMHADEKNRTMSAALGRDVYHYHLHIVYVPVMEKQILWSKRCKDPTLVGTLKETVMQVSRSKKWANQPILGSDGQQLKTRSGKPVFKKSYSVLQDDFYECMKAAGYTDIERGERGSTEEHLTVTQFKVQQEQQRLEELQETIQQTEQEAKETAKELRLLTAKVGHAEEIAKRFSEDPEKELPAASFAESAKSYRENKVKPAWVKVVKVLRSLYGMYLSAVDEIRKLKEQLTREQHRGDALAERNEDLLALVDEYAIVRKAIGQPTIDQVLEKHRTEKQAQKSIRQQLMMK